ncbi:LysR family transcriptional regulator [uncultured Ruegeria sp.]|jgi:DNA-binding transcriptional LysR family regulator|uniref:LysR family transcriptional regulator n=1 Tax=uncultured Ruegeria sp. TaxID=259304 RepID=UPI00261BFD9E|nr:LysR family transcriptional regulator [uncultured Ruegeria sp.]
MDTQWLDDVLALLEEGNLSRAAARRNITQPAFSRRIRSFEDWLGVPVLNRKTNRVEIGEALISNESEIRAILSQLREMRTKIVHHDPKANTVRIAAQHAQVFSRFPDMALKARKKLPGIKFRLHPANLSDCVSMFLRKDASMLLCYESELAEPLEFGANVLRGSWGRDYLIPVVGGSMRFAVKDGGDIPADSPSVVYPDNSYFGQVLRKKERLFGTAGFSTNPICETAFSTGIREMLLKGLGVAWLPFSMVHNELQSGDVISLANRLGKEPMDVAIYADRNNPTALSLFDIWGSAPK